MHEESTMLDKNTLLALNQKAKTVLESLITEQGIYASTDEGWAGPYHSWFGRDGAITTDLLRESIRFGGDRQLADRSLRGLRAFAKWQGKKDDAATGEQTGKLPHEIRTEFNDIDRLQHAVNTNQKPWYIDPADTILKNWDSADSTPLWIIAIIRMHRELELDFTEETLGELRAALGWILARLDECDGLVGFLGADEQPGRIYSGLHNQGWKDSYQIYQHRDGSLAKHPIRDILINADSWAALELGASLFKDDVAFADTLNRAADTLRQTFNSSSEGFLLPDKTYYAQALDGNGRQLTKKAADVAMSLWTYAGDTCVLDESTIATVINFAMGPQLFNPKAGLRNYAKGTDFPIGTRYHGGDNVYWPFVSGLVTAGLLHFGYEDEALRLANAYLSAVATLGSNIEMFTESIEGRLMPWHHPELGQMSSREQAWTAAAVYFGTLLLMNSSELRSS